MNEHEFNNWMLCLDRLFRRAVLGKNISGGFFRDPDLNLIKSWDKDVAFCTV
jgi:hypothetical protein